MLLCIIIIEIAHEVHEKTQEWKKEKIQKDHQTLLNAKYCQRVASCAQKNKHEI